MESSAKVAQRILSSLQESVTVKQAMLEDEGLLKVMGAVSAAMVRALREGRKLLFLGNGGSAADAQHLAAELVGRFELERRALPAIALTTNVSSLTAIGNDYSYERVFARQVEAIGQPGDVAVGISTSGKSPNVVSAIRVANGLGIVTVGMTGAEGRDVARLANFCIRIPSNRTARIQEGHITIGHILCELIEHELFEGGTPATRRSNPPAT